MAKPSPAPSSNLDRLPRLELLGPDGRRATFSLRQERTTIGRLSEFNDIALEPDPLQLVSRQVHCVVEKERGSWWVLDTGSVNGTQISRDGDSHVVQGRYGLEDGDQIKILGLLSDEGDPSYWTLTFVDPLKTKPARIKPARQSLEYDLDEARLFLVCGTARTKVVLAKKEHALIAHMVRRNASNGRGPVMCTHNELIAAVWGAGKADRTDLNHLVFQLRKKLPASEGQSFLEAERGLGYRLRTAL